MFLAKKGKGASASSLNVSLQALKFYFEGVNHRRKMYIELPYSKRSVKLPVFLDKEEVEELLKNIKNHYHKIIIAFLYSTGLRVGELVNLRVENLNLIGRYGIVRKGKGNKDRIFIISERLVGIIAQIITNNKLENEDYLFVNQKKGKYSVRTIQQIIKNACKNMGIKKNIHPHTMRHSFATHIIENGESISEVQALLGHKSPETTLIYVHTAKGKMIKVKSPYDV